MAKPINETDLHIKYKLDTGQNFQWIPKNNVPLNHSGTTFHSTERYTGAYAKWLEEQYLELVKTTQK